MSLILRGEINRRLTIPEMDGNFLYLEDLSLSVVGATGPTGSRGATGASGSITTILVTTFLPGATGPQGEPGLPGEPGPQGVPGLGVYFIGELGNTSSLPATASNGTSYIISNDVYIYGTNSWINAGPIIGPVGPTGSEGATGPMGPAGGPRGATGVTGPTGSRGATGASGSITTILVTTYLPGATGPQGEPGLPGEPGPQGVPGLGVYFIGELGSTSSLPATASNGTSYIISSDVYIYGTNSWFNAGPIIGPVGPTGSEGATGPMGPAGGPRGATGPTGPSPDPSQFISVSLTNVSGPTSGNLGLSLVSGSHSRGIELVDNVIKLNQDEDSDRFYNVSVNFYMYNNTAVYHYFRLETDTGSGFASTGLQLEIGNNAAHSYLPMTINEVLHITGSASLVFTRTNTVSQEPVVMVRINIVEIK